MKHVSVSFMSLVFGASLITGSGIFSLPGDVAAQTHENLKNTIQNQGKKTRGVVRDKNAENIMEFSQQHDMVKQDISALQKAIDEVKALVENLPGGSGPCEVPPVWGKTYATADRFVSVLGGAAFCDKATGLVWDGSPDPAAQANWQTAINHCTLRTVGDQHGFHLPMIEQLTSLRPLLATDLNSATGDGPFTDVQSAGYWSATTPAFNPSLAWLVNFSVGFVSSTSKANGNGHAWCARGGQAYDGQDVQE